MNKKIFLRKNKRKGFTLIELLAVIVVLAIILVVAVPRILGVVEESKKESFRISGENLVKAARDRQEMNLINPPVDKTYTILDGSFVGESLPMTGDLPERGTINVKADGSIGIALLKDGYCITKTFGQTQSTISKDIENCVIIEETPETCFEVDDVSPTEVKITSYSNSCPRDVIIPSTIGGKTVTIIGSFAFYKYEPSGQGYNDQKKLFAFNGSINKDDESKYIAIMSYGPEDNAYPITSVVIPDTVRTIDKYAFFANSLTSVTIPNSVTSIGSDAFSYNKLSTLTLSNNLEYIDSMAFFSNQLTSLTIPNSVTGISWSAFEDNRLNSLTLSNNLEYISDMAFASNQLTSVIIPNSVTDIYSYAFEDNLLTSITMPELVSIEPSTVSPNFMSSYSHVYVGSSGKYTASCQDCEWTHFSLPVPILATTPTSCFTYTSTATNVTITGYDPTCSPFIKIPETIGGKPVRHIGDYAFGFVMLVVYKETNSLLAYNDNRIHYNISDSFAYIRGDQDLHIKRVDLPSTLLTIGEGAFRYNEISVLVIPNSVTDIGSGAFEANPIYSITMPAGINIDQNMMGWNGNNFGSVYNEYYNKEAGKYLRASCGWINSNSSLAFPETGFCR